MPKRKTGKRMPMITLHLTEFQLRGLDRLVSMKIFPNRSEAIRAAISALLERYQAVVTGEPTTLALA